MVGVPQPGQANVQDAIGLCLASLAGIVISTFLREWQKEIASASTLGVFLTTFTYHNLVWQFPEVFEQVYGPDWVEFIQDLTEPSSLFMFVNTIKLS